MTPLDHAREIRITTPRLELRIPSEAELDVLCAVARAGVHDPSHMPFSVPWTDLPSPEFERSFHQFHHAMWETFGTPQWEVNLAVACDGELVGMQTMRAGKRRAPVGTGSWLGQRFQGRGIGTEMRAAVLAFAFEVLGVPFVESGAFVDNPASLAVSAKFGYVEVGRKEFAPRGESVEVICLELDRETWEARRPEVPVTYTGTDVALEVMPLPA